MSKKPEVKCRLGEIMEQKGLTNKKVIELTGVSRNTITSLAADATNRIDYETLAKLCKGLDVTPGDLLIYTPSEE
ncbi:helix-turn-helix domain-containing protein [Paenibacillus sp. LPE1-1-1.1]|uniref:helix-turn-helix domain-containing protein n=1 Tax=Paenibacillus sp. LPE1-1-1.1 TaxID=3135230 RepID=UPI00341AE458